MHLQTPVLSRLSLIRINIVVLIPHIIRGSARIPYTKLTMLIFTSVHHQPAIHTKKKKFEMKKKSLRAHLPTSKEDQVHGRIRVVRRAVHPILRDLGPRDDPQALQPLAQRRDLRVLLPIPLKHERIPIGRTPRMARAQQGLHPRAEPGERAGLPFLLPRERLEVQLLVPRLLCLARALFRRETLLLFLPSLRLLFLLYI
jgi:hypothetical protein